MKQYKIGDEIKLNSKQARVFKDRFESLVRLRSEARLILESCNKENEKLWGEFKKLYPGIDQHICEWATKEKVVRIISSKNKA